MSYDFYAAEYSVFHGAISRATNAASLKSIVRTAHQRLDQITNAWLTQRGGTFACHEGCSFCCNLKVNVMPEEVFLISEYLRAEKPSEEIDRIQSVADQNRNKIRSMTLAEHLTANLPCALLKGGKCSVYPVRPSPCRSFHAQRVETCQYSDEHPEDLNAPDSQIPELKNLLMLATEARSTAFEQCGYDQRSYDLNAALYEALTQPGCEERWFGKAPAFSDSATAKECCD